MPSPVSLSRRRLLGSLIAGGGLATLGVCPRAVWALKSQDHPVVLTGTTFDLAIGATPMSFTGRIRPTTSVNGSIPAPILHWKQGTEVTLRVTNLLDTQTSIHWHGILLPFQMDGVPGISFAGIAPGETFVYRFQVRQAGTYWYHAHTRFQEQTGLYGPLVIEPMRPDPIKVDRDYVVMLSEWTDENPEMVFAKLKKISDVYNFQMPTVGDFARDVSEMGLSQALAKRAMWNQMRMNPTDLADVSGATFTYLINGTPAHMNWTAIAKAGERVRLRLINGSATSNFDVRIPGIKLTVVSADGQDVEPVQVDEIRIAVAETYDVVVQMPDDKAYTIFAQSIDRSGYARATLAPEVGMQAEVPKLDPKTWLTMADMGMDDMASMDMGGMMDQHQSMTTDRMQSMGGAHMMPPMAPEAGMAGMGGHDMSSMPAPAQNAHAGMTGMDHGKSAAMPGMQKTGGEMGHDMGTMANMPGMGPQVDMRSMTPSRSLSDPGPRLRNNGRRVLTYADLKTLGPVIDTRPPSRELELRLTGNMRRFIWGIDGKKFSQAEPIRLYYGERLRITLINDTMMNHPMHLHGMFSELENHEGQALVRKHTINVQPSKQVSFLVTADAPGQWAFHCHLLYHMEAGMFRKIVVA
ncbi:copper resistance system multicopper oxidase [Cupriavidus sp. BIC8F]|uniref:copper resistance system multicopper oxidase n=1 Tax=Cupriavidus sp. BIC8F TaxID=3079014 RepID=UPI0029160E01|nr:copper resistance system multicopper oxidase [Cupriavidus sp. BIC8F]